MKISLTASKKEVSKNNSRGKLVLMFFVLNLLALNTVIAQKKSAKDLQTVERANLELSKIKVIPITDTQTDSKYELYIKLPEGYTENDSVQYPVIYYTDAMWHVEMLSGSAEYIMEEAFLVGISWRKDISDDLMEKYGAHASRFTDYSFWEKTNLNHPLLQFGQASSHLTFIRNDVFSYVEQNYRTKPSERSYFGYSLGGLFGAFILVTQPETFKNYILGSPSVNLLAKYKVEFTDEKTNANVFISNGTLEKELHEAINEFTTLLKEKNNERLSLKHVEIEGNHGTAFPMTAIRSIQWLSQMDKEDHYFGETPPGLTPKLFAPPIVSPEGLFEGGSFSPDKKSYYFSRKNGKYEERTFFVIRYENGGWGNESETDLKWPKFSKGADTLFRGNKYRIQTDSGWSEYKSLGVQFSDKHIMGISFSDNGTSYFDEIVFDEFGKPDTVGAISYSRRINGKYEPRQKMGEEINTGTWIAHPHVAPDESYLIWDVRREDGYGGSDIYISFRREDGSWIPEMNMGNKINTALSESGARISDDGKYLFFTRGEWEIKEDGSENWLGKPYWVDAQVIENLRPKQ